MDAALFLWLSPKVKTSEPSGLTAIPSEYEDRPGANRRTHAGSVPVAASAAVANRSTVASAAATMRLRFIGVSLLVLVQISRTLA
jgi:hypothetical protein